MAITYSTTAINARLNGVVTALSTAPHLVITGGGVTLCTITMANPAGTVSGGVLTFTTPITGTGAVTGNADGGYMTNSASATQISGFTVGIPLSGADIIISNGLNSTLISSGQSITLLSAQITGS